MKNRKKSLLIAAAAMVVFGVSVGSVALADTAKIDNFKHFDRGSGQPERQGQHGLGVMGKVSSIDGTIIILTGKQGFGEDATDVTYTIDASNATVRKFTASSEGKPTETVISASDIQVGDMIMVRGEVDGTSVVAKEIMTGQPGQGLRKNGGNGHQGNVPQIRGRKGQMTPGNSN